MSALLFLEGNVFVLEGTGNSFFFFFWFLYVRKHTKAPLRAGVWAVFASVYECGEGFDPVAKGIVLLDGELLKLWVVFSFLNGPQPCHHFMIFSL